MVETAKKPKEAKRPKKGASKRKKGDEKQKSTDQSEQSFDAENGAIETGRYRSQELNPVEKGRSTSKTLQQNVDSLTKRPSKSSARFIDHATSSKNIIRGSLKVPTSVSLGMTDVQKSVLFVTPERDQVSMSSSHLIKSELLEEMTSSSSSSSEDEDGDEERRQETKDKKKKKKEKQSEEIASNIVKIASSAMQMKKSKSKAKKKEEMKVTNIDKNIELSKALIEKSKLKALPTFASIRTETTYSKDTESLGGVKKTKKEKGKGKRKASSRKGGKLKTSQSQKLKTDQEEEAAKKAEEKIRLEQERLAAIEKAKKGLLEHQMREDQLAKCFGQLQSMVDNHLRVAEKQREEEQWEFYLKCGKLPDITDCGAMTTYLHLWRNGLQESTIEDVSERTQDVIELLKNIDDVYNSPLKIDDAKLENLNWIHQLLRESLEENLTFVTLNLISNIETNLRRIDPLTADFNFQDENFTFNIWLRVPTPICLPNPRKPMKPKIEITFTNLDMRMIFPLCIHGENMAVRVMHLKYDHLSDRCDNYHIPEASVRETMTLPEVADKEWKIRQIYSTRSEHQPDEEISQSLATTKSTLVLEKSLSFALKDASSSVACLLEEYLEYEEDRKLLEVDAELYVVNLRKYRIIGGIYHINLIGQPLQPQHLVTVNLTTTNYLLPKRLDVVEYGQTVKEVKRMSSMRVSRSSVISEMIMNKRSEEERERRIKISLKMPSEAVFFETPIVAYWDEDIASWTHEPEDAEIDGDTILFMIESYGAFGLVATRYINLPYEHWIIKPNEDSSIEVEIRTRMMELLFRVKGDVVSLVQAAKSPNDKAFEVVLNKPMKLYRLIDQLRRIGVDIFPEFDAFLYVEPNYEKQWAMEEHLYLDMARLSHTFKFARSKWNSQAGFRNIILQIKEISPTRTMKQKCLLHVTPLKATLLRSTENAVNFNLDEADNIRFSADLYNLMKVTSGIAVRKMIEDACPETTMGVYKLLKATRFLSYS